MHEVHYHGKLVYLLHAYWRVRIQACRYNTHFLMNHPGVGTLSHRDHLVRLLMQLVGLDSSQPIAPTLRKNAALFFHMVQQCWKQSTHFDGGMQVDHPTRAAVEAGALASGCGDREQAIASIPVAGAAAEAVVAAAAMAAEEAVGVEAEIPWIKVISV